LFLSAWGCIFKSPRLVLHLRQICRCGFHKISGRFSNASVIYSKPWSHFCQKVCNDCK
jgi:hypothetical protein